MDSGQARGIVARKTGVHGQRIHIHLHLVAQRFQPGNAPFESRLVAHGARGRINVDVFGPMVVGTLRMVVVIVQSAQALGRPAP